jgi:polysaccharide biosynthesis protein PslH
MKILWVKAGGLVPPDTGGKIRSYNILRELARNHSVTFLSFYGAHECDLHPELKNIFDHVVCIPLDLPAPRGFAELCDYLGRIFSPEPYGITKYCRPQVRHELLRLLQQESYQVILCDFLAAAGVIPWDHPCPKVLFTHNVEAVIWQRHYEVVRNPLWKALSWREWQATRVAEGKYLRLADHVLAVSENDRDSFATFLDSSRVTVIPTGVDTEYFQPSPQEEAPDSLVFTGSMDWLPNEDAILYFVREILPLIRQQIPQVSLSVVGRKPSRRVRELAANQKNVQLTGWVDDIRPYLASGTVCIVPLRIGGGTRLKIFEAMGMAKAVVSTSIGAEGLPLRHGENVLLADEPAEFAACVVSLLRHPAHRKRLGQASRKLVEENYSWARVAERFANVLSEVVAKSQPQPASAAVTQY